jgi:hypothetical protein
MPTGPGVGLADPKELLKDAVAIKDSGPARGGSGE